MPDIPESDEVRDQAQFDTIEATLFQQVREGLMNVRWDDETGEAHFQLTAKGKKAAEDLIRGLVQDGDHDGE